MPRPYSNDLQWRAIWMIELLEYSVDEVAATSIELLSCPIFARHNCAHAQTLFSPVPKTVFLESSKGSGAKRSIARSFVVIPFLEEKSWKTSTH